MRLYLSHARESKDYHKGEKEKEKEKDKDGKEPKDNGHVDNHEIIYWYKPFKSIFKPGI